MTDLPDWQRPWQALGVASDTTLETERLALLAAYAEPQRHYHTRQHLDECLALFATLRVLAERPAEVELALWFHDAIYDPRAHDNEERSAAWARDVALAAGVNAAAVQRIFDLVMATRHDAEPAGIDAQVLVDVDLAILGAPRARFDEYDAQIAREYAWVPAEAYRSGRAKVLRSFLERPRIFHSQQLFDEREERARKNLAHSLAALGRP